MRTCVKVETCRKTGYFTEMYWAAGKTKTETNFWRKSLQKNLQKKSDGNPGVS